jgi:hypothetical protein
MSIRPLLLLLAGVTLYGGMNGTVWSAGAQQPASPAPSPDVATLGPQVGDKVPDFALSDQKGQTQSLSSLAGPKGLVLVFSRSADW